MLTTDTSMPADGGKKHLAISLLLLGGLLFLRFPFLIGGDFMLANGTAIQKFLLLVIFSGGTSTLTAALIWWERKRLKDFWIDLAGAITFLCQIFCLPIGIGLFWAMRRSRARFPSPPANVWRWALIGAALAVICEIFIVNSAIEPPASRASQSAGFSFLIPSIFIQMTNAAVWEEPLFRGFLWGYLRLARWKNIWIWLFQAAFFTLGHVYYLRYEVFGPWLIRLMIPSLLIGFIAWQAKSIFASIVTHGLINASHDMLTHTRSLSEAMQVGWSAVIVILAILAAIWIRDRMRRQPIPAAS